MNVLPCKIGVRRGWWCSRNGGHPGPCALRPRWWNLAERYATWRHSA